MGASSDGCGRKASCACVESETARRTIPGSRELVPSRGRAQRRSKLRDPLLRDPSHCPSLPTRVRTQLCPAAVRPVPGVRPLLTFHSAFTWLPRAPGWLRTWSKYRLTVGAVGIVASLLTSSSAIAADQISGNRRLDAPPATPPVVSLSEMGTPVAAAASLVPTSDSLPGPVDDERKGVLKRQAAVPALVEQEAAAQARSVEVQVAARQRALTKTVRETSTYRSALKRSSRASGVSGRGKDGKVKYLSPDGSTEAPADAASGRQRVFPVAKRTMGARFGAVGSWSRYHTGLDFRAGSGTPIRAAQAGTVTFAGSSGDWAGNYVTIRHPDGVTTQSSHMSTVSVEPGQRVVAGQVIGAVGNTGRSFGSHLHFELYPAGVEPGDVYRAVNPLPWLTKG